MGLKVSACQSDVCLFFWDWFARIEWAVFLMDQVNPKPAVSMIIMKSADNINYSGLFNLRHYIHKQL